MCVKETTLVLGCTGVIGGRVAERLWDRGYRIRPGSRTADPAFDWLDSAGWPAVVEGVAGMYVALPAELECEGREPVLARFLDVASLSGVRRVVFRSRGRGRSFERVVQAAGLDWTIVRLARLVQRSAGPLGAERLSRGDVELRAGDAPFTEADHVAHVIFEILTSGSHAGRVYDLTGARPVMYAGV